jgi:prepilin-type N-terminal cleavage/methylation domain-containing protein
MRNRRRGFTLIEVLVISAITAVLLALFLPAVAEAQEEARKNQCKNHLKQMGLAMHNYHDTHKTFPPGWVSQKPDAAEGPFFGWGSFLLPFVEQAPLYNQLTFSAFKHNREPLLKTVILVFRCPSDPMADLNPLRGDWATSSYSGNAGDERLPGSLDTPEKMNGIMWRNSRVRLRDILDGTSNTFLMGERGLRSASGNVKAVFQGHSHQNDLKEIGNIHYCTLVAMVEGSGEQNNAYTMMTVTKDGSIALDGFVKQKSYQWEGKR